MDINKIKNKQMNLSIIVMEKTTGKTNHFYVITGGPGVGKTTLLNELVRRGFRCVPEVAREIIREQVRTGGDGLPWKNREYYIQLMLKRSIESYRQVERKGWQSDAVFFDRGIIDTLCYATLIGLGVSQKMDNYANHYRYHPTVFILPPWKEIYQTDSERKQGWEEAVSTYRHMGKIYRKYAYEITEVPKAPVERRVDFILAAINKNR